MVMAPSLNGVLNLSPTALSGPSTSVANRPASCSTASTSSAVSSPPWASAALSPAPCLSAKPMSATGAREVMDRSEWARSLRQRFAALLLVLQRQRLEHFAPLGRLGSEHRAISRIVQIGRFDRQQRDFLLHVGLGQNVSDHARQVLDPGGRSARRRKQSDVAVRSVESRNAF